MHADPLAGLFKRRLEIERPGGAAEGYAQQLAACGLLHIMEREYVRCINPLDRDQCHVKEHTCAGKIYLSHDRDEDNGDYQCPDCGRVVFPSQKRRSTSIRLLPEQEAMSAFIAEQIRCLGGSMEERPRGLFRIPMDTGEVQVCLVDACYDAAVFSSAYPYRGTLVYVVGNDRDYLRRLPGDAIVFRLAELALGGAAASFQRTLRQLVKQKPAPVGPAVLRLDTPLPMMPVANGQRMSALAQGTQISVPQGTGWSQLAFYLVDGETVAIKVPGRRLERYRHHELGMTDKRSGKPTKKWKILESLCESYGELSWHGTRKEFGAFKEQVSGLRWLLQRRFGIAADPLPTCSQESGLRAAFQAFPALPDTPYLGEMSW